MKGPGDRLSHKQILWLDYLLGLGVDAEVCYVKGRYSELGEAMKRIQGARGASGLRVFFHLFFKHFFSVEQSNNTFTFGTATWAQLFKASLA